MPNPLLGVLFHWIGGFASASFYVPYKSVRRWSWEVFWLTGGLVSWIVAPWLFASLQTRDLLVVLAATPIRTLGLCWMFGALWGFGGLTFGLTMRYLGISLGTAVALGLTAAFGTLIPPLVSGQLVSTLIHSTGGQIVLFGVAVALGGIFVVGLAGHGKEREQADQAVVGQPKPVNFGRGIAVAVFSGVMSSCFAYGLAAGEPIRQLTLAHGTPVLSQGLPVLCVVLFGGYLHQRPMVPISPPEEPQRRSVDRPLLIHGLGDRSSPALEELSALFARRSGLVFPVLLLHHG